MHRMLIAIAALAVAAPAVAQGTMGHDPTNKVVGSGQLPPGWMLRFDTPRRGPVPATSEISFTVSGTGYQVKSGPAAIYYNPKDTASGEYSVGATFSQKKSMLHEGYGIFIGGSNLQDSTQSYLYFLVRPIDGSYLINHRAGTAVHKIVDWTISGAMGKEDEMGKASNQLTIRVSKDSVHFVANGRQVKAFAKSSMRGFNTDGQAGLRINHNLDIHIEGFAVKPAAK